MSRKGRSTHSGIFQEHSLYSNAKGSVTPEGQVSETVPLHLFLLWSPLFEAKSNVKLHRWPPGAGALAADVRYLTTVWLWGSQAYSILYLFPTCLLSASKAASHPSNKLHGTMCRASGITRWEKQPVSYLPLRTSVSRAFISPTMVGNGAQLPKFLSLSACASQECFVAQI